jgi:hypothetical protein
VLMNDSGVGRPWPSGPAGLLALKEAAQKARQQGQLVVLWEAAEHLAQQHKTSSGGIAMMSREVVDQSGCGWPADARWVHVSAFLTMLLPMLHVIVDCDCNKS